MGEDLATQSGLKTFEDGIKNDFIVEQALAHELGTNIESKWEKPREITVERLEEMFKPVLYNTGIDRTWSEERQVDSFLRSDEDYLALTTRGSYEGLVSRLSVLNEFVRSIVKQTNN